MSSAQGNKETEMMATTISSTARGRAVTSTPDMASAMFDCNYSTKDIKIAFKRAKDLLDATQTSAKITPALRDEICFSYAVQEQDEGLRSQLRGTLDNMALISALFLTITFPAYLSPPDFYALVGGAEGATEVGFEMAEDTMVRVWMLVGGLTLIFQGMTVVQTMLYRVFTLDTCVSDLHFLPIAACTWYGWSGITSISLFIAGVVGTALWFMVSGFVIYNSTDVYAMLGVTVAIGAIVAYHWLSGLFQAQASMKMVVQSFVKHHCDADGDPVMEDGDEAVVVQQGSH